MGPWAITPQTRAREVPESGLGLPSIHAILGSLRTWEVTPDLPRNAVIRGRPATANLIDNSISRVPFLPQGKECLGRRIYCMGGHEDWFNGILGQNCIPHLK